ncbi:MULTISPECIES: peptide chain release factor N(5)-glutamine methyltransferase [Gulbenkiania]|uniref:Release factor glutamine methyltransferase n=1 Tax=Gulbenkiania indica TaxID=375574 RepID=A0A0K6GS51_9NEIS|nr:MULTISPECIES: peptide chain release factor N(5)-glutamine methyltransferase [Gulbenkiania]CUA81545.1 protein-(glutamine-N5) methyltransferase, release factor-specific [Gulbenkiania indica]
MTTLAQALQAFPLPRLEARLLLMHASGCSHVDLIAHGDRTLLPETEAAFADLAGRRLAGEPVAYLLGAREFFGRPFQVSPAVLIPRPDTERLVETALERAATLGCCRVLDLGTGSGAVAITLALEAPHCAVSAVDVSPAALEVARRNAEALSANVRFLQGSWFTPLPSAERFELIVSNPPYIPAGDPHLAQGDVRFEPQLALTDGDDGLSCLRHVAQEAPYWLVPGGWLLVEHGYDQGRAVRHLFESTGFCDVTTTTDLGGNERVTQGRRP